MNQMRWTKEGVGEKYVDIIVSLSAQSVALHGEKTALANYAEIPSTLKTQDAIAAAIEEVNREIKDVPGHSGEYMRVTMTACACFLRILAGDDIPYRQRVKDIQQVDFNPIPQQNYAVLREQLDKELADLGYRGTAEEKINAFLQAGVLSAEKVTSTAKELIAGMRTAALQRVTSLPQDEGITAVNGVTGVFWSGFSQYDGKNKGQLTFNLERPWSVPTFANVLSHEAYPGHQTFYCLWDVLYLAGKLPLEGAFYQINAPTNCLFEGGPENGLDFLGWIAGDGEDMSVDPATKKAYTLGRKFLDLQRMAQTQACYLHHVEGASKEEAQAYMVNSKLLTEIEAANVVRFFTNPVQATYYPAYYYGKHIVRQAFHLYGPARREEFFRELYTVPHTNSTFIKAVSAGTGSEFRPFDSI